jgi:hypothetical protein
MDLIGQALENNQAFFAFSDKQFKESCLKGVDYVSLGMGLICPKQNAKNLVEELKAAQERTVQIDLENNTKKEIIMRELANHEAQITGEIEDTLEALAAYDISREEVAEVYKEYFEYCCEHDLF